MLEADLKKGQHVSIKRLVKDNVAYIWLHDVDTGQPASEIQSAAMKNPFNFTSPVYDKQCAKGSV